MLLQITSSFVTLLSCLAVVNGHGEDLTREANTAGSSVVEAAVGLIQGSSIFQSDNRFLRRLAYVESKDGIDPTTYRGGYYGGIWQVDEVAFQATKDVTTHRALMTKYAQIRSVFGFNWTDVQWTDLSKPLYSALAARLFLFNLATSIPFGIKEQADYWMTFYHTKQGNKTVATFVQDVQLFERSQNCSARAVDLVFVLDQSGSIGPSNFQLVRDLCANLVRGFDIETSHTRIGVIGFSSSASIVIPLDQYNTTSALIQAVQGIPYPAQGTDTAAGINLIPAAFAVGGRKSLQAVPKIAVVITDGQSNDATATLNAATTLHSSYSSITVYAVGVGSGIVYSELTSIASDSSKVSDLASFSVSQFQDLQSSISGDTCTTPAKVQVNESVISSMNKNTTSYFVLDISSRGLTLQLTAKIGALLLYTSCSLSTPNEAFYSWKLFTDATTNRYVSCGTGNSAVLYISVRGYMASNSFAFTAITGDFSTPQPPTGPPQEVTAIITDKGEVLVQWAPPLEYRQNGYIDKYSILLTDKETGEERETFVDSFLFQYNIRSLLLSGHFYSLRVRGHNSDGYGPYSEALAVSKVFIPFSNSGIVADVRKLVMMAVMLLSVCNL